MQVILYSSKFADLASSFFFFNDTATTEIYTLSLHDALPISGSDIAQPGVQVAQVGEPDRQPRARRPRSEEHTSELQSHSDLVCRLLLENKKFDDFDDTRLLL